MEGAETIINVYAPAEPGGRRKVFEEVRAVCLTSRYLVLGGILMFHLKAREILVWGHLERLVQDFDLINSFKKVNLGVEGVTWGNSRGSRSRIDFVFLQRGVSMVDSEILPVFFSDHHVVKSSFLLPAPVFGRGFWKLNVGILHGGIQGHVQGVGGFQALI